MEVTENKIMQNNTCSRCLTLLIFAVGGHCVVDDTPNTSH